jgi:hypothetical protein
LAATPNQNQPGFLDSFEEKFMITSEMTTTLTHQAYQISHDSSHREGYGETELPDYDAWLISDIPGSKDFNGGFWRPQQLEPPRQVEFMCVWEFLQINDLRRTRVTDFPYNRERWPIMSKGMLEVLLSVREFPHQVIPIVMLSDHADSDEKNYEFVAVQLLEHQDVFDWEKSVCERNMEIPNCIKFGSLESAVFIEPSDGFPPLFRVATVPLTNRLYVSAEGKAALEAAGVRGVSFLESLEI